MAKSKKGRKGFEDQDEYNDGLDEALGRGKKNSKEKRFRESNEDNELAAFTENLEKFNPTVAIEKASDEVAEASDLALQETQELMPDGATPAQEAIVEGFDEQINAAKIEAQEALERLNQERIEDEQKQQLSEKYLDAFTSALRVEIQDKNISSQEVVFDVYHQAINKAREQVEISHELEISLHSRMMKILEEIQDELSPEVGGYEDDNKNEESEEKDEKLKQPQAGINDFGALAALRDTLPQDVGPSTNNERALVKEEQPDVPETQTKSLEQEIQFRQTFANQLMRELKVSGMPRDEEILDNIYRRTLDKVFDDFNAKLPISSGRGYTDPRKHTDQELYPREYGIYVDKISRDRAVEIAREVRAGVEAYLKDGVSPDKKIFNKELSDKIDVLSEVDFLANPNELSAEILPQINTEKKEVKKESQTPEAPIDFSKIERGFAIIWRTPKSEERGTVVSVSNKTILVGRKTEAGKAIRVPKTSVVTVLNQYGDVIMGEGSKITTESAEQRAEKVLNYGDLSPQEKKAARIQFLRNFATLVEQGFQSKNPFNDEQAKDVLLTASSQAEASNTVPLTVRPLQSLRNPMAKVFNDIRNGNIQLSDAYFDHIVDDVQADMRLSLLDLAFSNKTEKPDIEKKGAVSEEKLSEENITHRITSAHSFSDLQKILLDLQDHGVMELMGSDKSYSIAQLSEYLTDMRWLGLGVSDRLTRAYGLRVKAIELWKDADLKPIMSPGVENELREKITQSHNLDDIYHVIYEYCGLMDVTNPNRKYSAYELKKAIEFAENNPKDLERYQYVTRLYGLLDKIKEILEARNFIEGNPLEGDQIEDVIEKMRTFSFTDAAGKEVELKVGDKLYLIIPDEKQIETYVIEDLDTDNGFYLSDGNWYELHSDYYSDIDDAEKNVVQLGVDAENNTPGYQPEFNLDSANSVADKIRIINDRIQKFTEEEKLAHKDALKALGDITDKWMDLRQQLLHDLAGIPAAELDLDLRELEEDIDQIASLLAIDFPVKQSNENIDIPKLEESLSADEEARISEHAELLKVQEEFEKLSPEEQKKVSWGIRNIGFKIKEKKSEFFAKCLRVSSNNSNTTTLGRFMNALADTYKQDAEKARHLIELAESRKDDGSAVGLAKSRAMSIATTVGMIAKAGRTVSDLSGASLASPLRYVMMGAMGAARLSEAGKEARISTLIEKNPNIIHPVEPADWEKFIKAWVNHQEMFKNEGKTEEELLESFRTAAVVNDLDKRLSAIQEADKGLGVIQNILQSDVLYTLDQIKKSINDINLDIELTPDQKAKEKMRVLEKYAQHIKTLEHVVDEYGKVDALATTLKYTETGSKAAVMAMTIETLLLSADVLYDSVVNIAKKTADLVSEIKGDVAQHLDALNSEPVPVSDPVIIPKPVVLGIKTTPEDTPLPTSTTPAPIEVTPTSPANSIEDFTKEHRLYENTDAEITSVANGIKVEYQIGGEKGDFATLDQALRRVVAQEIDIGKGNELDATEATRAENVLANLRQLLEGKSVIGIKPEEIKDFVEFKDGKLTILDYAKFDTFTHEKLFTHAEDFIDKANIETGYANTSTSKWQDIFDQRAEKTTVDFGPSADVKVPEVAESTATDATAGANPEVPSPAAPVETTTPTEAPIDSGAITETLNKQTPETVGGNGSMVDVKPRSLQEVAIDATPYPAEYMGDVLGKMTPDQASALAEVMREAKIDADKWERINFIIEGNTELLQNANGKFDTNQVELALGLSDARLPRPAELRLALEAMQVIRLEEAQEAAIVQAIMNPKEGPKALEKLFGDSSGNRGAKVTLNPRKGILHFENLGPQKLDGNMNFREGVLRIGKRAGAIFGGKFPLKNLVQAINSFK